MVLSWCHILLRLEGWLTGAGPLQVLRCPVVWGASLQDRVGGSVTVGMGAALTLARPL